MEVIIFLVVGAAFAMFGVFLVVTSIQRKKRCTQNTVGKVIDVETEEKRERIDDTRREPDGSFVRTYGPAQYRTTISHYPIYQYVVNDKEYVRKSNSQSSLGRLEIGKEKNIYYNPDNPEDCYIQGEEKSSIAMGVIMIIIGIVAAIMGTVVGNSKIQ